jgi:hypothetical protein
MRLLQALGVFQAFEAQRAGGDLFLCLWLPREWTSEAIQLRL